MEAPRPGWLRLRSGTPDRRTSSQTHRLVHLHRRPDHDAHPPRTPRRAGQGRDRLAPMQAWRIRPGRHGQVVVLRTACGSGACRRAPQDDRLDVPCGLRRSSVALHARRLFRAAARSGAQFVRCLFERRTAVAGKSAAAEHDSPSQSDHRHHDPGIQRVRAFHNPVSNSAGSEVRSDDSLARLHPPIRPRVRSPCSLGTEHEGPFSEK